MIQESIQVRRISDKVKRYFEIFGFRHYTRSYGNRVSIKAGKRLGGDEVECVVSETARGTTIGFYRINSLHGLIYTIPFIFLYLIYLLNQLSFTSKFISGSKTLLGIDYKQLLVGDASGNLTFPVILLGLCGLIFAADILTQELRLSNIKSRFSFFSRDAIWETREVPPSILSLQTLKSTITNGYILAILYFSVFSFGSVPIREVTSTYRTDVNSLKNAIILGYSITCGLLIGIMSGDKALNLRRINASYDSRSRLSGGILERRIENITFAIQTTLINGFILLVFLSQTFYKDATIVDSVLFFLFAIIGSIISSFIYQDEPIWITSVMAASLFFTTIIFIFRTGSHPSYAFLVFLQLFLIPTPFVYHFSRFYIDILKENRMNTVETLYDILPITSLYSIRKQNQRKKLMKKAYEDQLSEDYVPDKELQQIRLEREYFEDKSSSTYLLARHYFELLTSYAASFEENRFILVPTAKQLLDWWSNRSGETINDTHRGVIDYIDRLLWDLDVNVNQTTASSHEQVGRKMVVAIQR